MKLKYVRESEVLKALAHPVRLQMVEIITSLREDECSVSTIQKKLGMPQSTVSQHLQILRNKGIIEGNKRKAAICYRVKDRYAKEILRMLTGS
ncbi:MAG: transcriptional regulator [Candidatus Latescibacterota bacterium]|nr:MAG: transcriptional regulator [Candidatus Latescibacterota bacterium]RKY73504.1 MAG: transcriptional regulator [Candidatus Latescibacterota bacterium]